VRSETKIFNLETHEFSSNPPLKKQFGGSNCLSDFWREQKLKKNWWEVKGAGALKKFQVRKPGTF
jgi:hypothetical protein